ncbi:MAG: Type 1 glutamine amidotransferase-like domain-containing protein [Lachnospiraceae bacterium]|nr:Type 1 glutamine amidotransferase-like domain-containing protein [Lachnospiraceae bacterium]MBR3684131.1 Type 1 glutamine amidotransferase-like domain-containing protein [Lachnospiraceae bacterium]
MVLFLTSSPGGSTFDEKGVRIPCPLDERNSFVALLKEHLPAQIKCLFVSSAPDDLERNEGVRSNFETAFKLSGIRVIKTECLDGRSGEITAEYLDEFDLLILTGGHVPTQNAFFEKIGLREKIAGYKGVVVGISAGTMNSARVVYAMPELEGESLDKGFKRFIPGLGLTESMVIPHYQYLKTITLDGKKMMEEIAYPDSMGRRFYALCDGSFILRKDGKETIYGEAYIIEDGVIRQICCDNQIV